LRFFKFTLLLLLLFTFACRRQKSKKGPLGQLVLFDAYKEQVWPIKDTGFAGYSSLNLFLKNLGYITEENHKPYKEVFTGLSSEALFIIGVAMEARFTRNEVKDILDFVGRGGKLLIIAEHDNKYGSSDFLRPLINAAGWEISNGRVISESDSFPGTERRWIRTRLPSGREGPILLCAAELTVMREKSCKVLLTSLNGEHIVAGLGNYGKGKIAIIGDSEFLWNADQDYRWKGIYPLSFCDPKTKDFIKDLVFSMLPPQEDTSRSNDSDFFDNPLSSQRVFVYGNGGCFKNYSKFLNALNRAGVSVLEYQEGIEVAPKDRVIVITPLKKIPQKVIDELSRSKKAVFFGDMYSSVKSYAESWHYFFKPHKINPVIYPLNSIAEKYGVRFLPSFGVNFKDNEYGNILYIPVFFNKKRLYLHRACAIELLDAKKNEEIYFENSKETFACKAGFGLNHTLKFKDPKDVKNPDFLIVTDKALAIGDSDIISDIFLPDAERSGLLEMIINFLLKEIDKNPDD
jgi:hypothetical protein